MGDEQPRPITLQLDRGRSRTFGDSEQVTAWLHAERAKLDAVRGWAKGDQELDSVVAHYDAGHQRALKAARTESWQAVTQQLQESHIPHGQEAITSLILEVGEADGPQAVAMLGYFMVTGFTNAARRPAIARGYLRAALFDLGIMGNVQPEHAALSALYADGDSMRSEATIATAELHRAKETAVAEAEKASAESSEVFRTEIDAAKAKLEALELSFREKMSLRAPVAYLTSQRGRHRNFALCWGIAAVVVLAGVVLFLNDAVHDLLNLTRAELDKMELWRFGLLALYATFGVWLVRLCVRMFLSHAHLRADADERGNLVQTYLALLAEPNAVNPEERTTILALLFRPAAIGLVKDDSGPSNPFDAVGGALFGRGKKQ